MKYATWKLLWVDNNYGFGPEDIIASRGGICMGVFFTGEDPRSTIVGYVSDDVSLDGLEEWDFAEATQNQILYLAKIIDSQASIDDNGNIVFSKPNRNV